MSARNGPTHLSDAEVEGNRERKLLTLGWRVFAEIRRKEAKRELKALSTSAARVRRRRGLPICTAADAAVSVMGVPLYLDVSPQTVLLGGYRAVSMTRRGRLLVSAIPDGTQLKQVDISSTKSRPRDVLALCDNVVATSTYTKISRFERSILLPAHAINRVRTWNVDTEEALGEIKFATLVTALAAVNPRRFVVGSDDGRIFFCAHTGGRRLHVTRQAACAVKHSSAVTAFSVCGDRLASASDDNTVAVWDVKTCARLAVLGGPGATIYDLNCVDISDNLVVAGFTSAPYMRAFSVSDGYSCISTNHAIGWVHGRGVKSLYILDSDYVISASWDLTIAISSVHSNSILARLRIGFTPRCMTVLPGGFIAVSDRECGACSSILTAPPAAFSLLKAYGDYEYV